MTSFWTSTVRSATKMNSFVPVCLQSTDLIFQDYSRFIVHILSDTRCLCIVTEHQSSKLLTAFKGNTIHKRHKHFLCFQPWGAFKSDQQPCVLIWLWTITSKFMFWMQEHISKRLTVRWPAETLLQEQLYARGCNKYSDQVQINKWAKQENWAGPSSRPAGMCAAHW